jgi:hypothetical protein
LVDEAGSILDLDLVGPSRDLLHVAPRELREQRQDRQAVGIHCLGL